MNLEHQLSNAEWVDVEDGREDYFLGLAGKFVETPEVLGLLEGGAEVRIGTGWSDVMRIKVDIVFDTPTPQETVRCDCGHTVPRLMRASASMGSACPECYDRMSD